MAKKTLRDSHALLLVKKNCYMTRISGYVKGSNKNFFIDDTIKRGVTESQMVQHIVDVYYSIVTNIPDVKGKEMDELKKIINERIKL